VVVKCECWRERWVRKGREEREERKVKKRNSVENRVEVIVSRLRAVICLRTWKPSVGDVSTSRCLIVND
jgi:hypothetical protein